MGAVWGVVLKKLLMVQDGGKLTLRWVLSNGEKIRDGGCLGSCMKEFPGVAR